MEQMSSVWTGTPQRVSLHLAARTTSSPSSCGTPGLDSLWPNCEEGFVLKSVHNAWLQVWCGGPADYKWFMISQYCQLLGKLLSWTNQGDDFCPMCHCSCDALFLMRGFLEKVALLEESPIPHLFIKHTSFGVISTYLLTYLWFTEHYLLLFEDPR